MPLIKSCSVHTRTETETERERERERELFHYGYCMCGDEANPPWLTQPPTTIGFSQQQRISADFRSREHATRTFAHFLILFFVCTVASTNVVRR